MRNAWDFPSLPHNKRNCSKTYPMMRVQKIGPHTFPKVGVLPLCPMVYFIPWEMNGYHHQYHIAWENVAKLILWGESGKLIAILFPKYEWLLSIRFPFCGMLYHKVWMGYRMGFLINFQ